MYTQKPMVDLEDVQIYNTTQVEPFLPVEKLVRLEEIRTEQDLVSWREHNQRVASYLAMLVRGSLFEEGSALRDLYLSGQNLLPLEIQQAMSTWDALNRRQVESDFTIEEDDMGDRDLVSEITIEGEEPAEIRERRATLKRITDGEEMSSHFILWMGDALGVPLVIHYTADNPNGITAGGHAQALVRTPYQTTDGGWVYDVMDPMQLHVTEGLRLNASTRDGVYAELKRRMFCNQVGSHILENGVEFNLLANFSGTPAYELIRDSSVSKIQAKDYVNCQFMALLIQAYLHSFSSSLYDHTGSSIPGGGISDIIRDRFRDIFNVEIKTVFDLMKKVEPFPVSMRN